MLVGAPDVDGSGEESRSGDVGALAGALGPPPAFPSPASVALAVGVVLLSAATLSLSFGGSPQLGSKDRGRDRDRH
jgi:hypothetical protein